MTNEEAIRKIESQKLWFLEEYVDYSGVSEAYDMAIQALKKQILQDGVIVKGVSKPTECNGCFFDNPISHYCCKAVDFSKLDETIAEILEEWYIASQEHRRPKWCPVEA